MAGQLSKLLIRFGIDTSALSKAEPQVKKSLNSIEKGVHSCRNAVLSLAGAAGFGGLGYVAVSVGKTFLEFEDAMLKVQAVAKPTAEEFQALTDLARQLSTQTEYSSAQIAQGMYELSSAGMNAAQQMKVMPAVLNLATAGQLEMSEAAAVVVQSLAGFNLSGEQATHVTDVLAESVNKTMLHFSDLALSMKYVAPIAGATHQSIEDLVAALGLMSNAGIRGEQAGTTLRAGFVRLMDPTNEVTRGIKLLGLTYAQINPATQTFSNIIGALSGAMKGVDETTRNQALSMIFGSEALSGFLALLNAGPAALDQLSASLKNSEGAAKTTAETMRQSISIQLKELKNTLIDALYPAFEQLKPSLEGMIARIKEWATEGKIKEWAEGVINGLRTTWDVLSTGFGLIQKVIEFLGGWKNALYALGAAWAALKMGSWISTIGSVATKLAAMKIGGAAAGAAGAAGAAEAVGGGAAVAAGASGLAVAGGAAAAAAAAYGIYRIFKWQGDEAAKTNAQLHNMQNTFDKMGLPAKKVEETVRNVGMAAQFMEASADAAGQSLEKMPQMLVGAMQGKESVFRTLGGESMRRYVAGLLEQAGYTEDAASGVAGRIVEKLQSGDEGARVAGVKQIQSLIAGMVEAGILAEDKAKEINQQLDTAFRQSAPEAFTGADLFGLDKLRAMEEYGRKMGSLMVGSLGGAFSAGMRSFPVEITDALQSTLPAVRQEGITMLTWLANGMAQGLGYTAPQIQGIMAAIANSMNSQDPVIRQQGIDMMLNLTLGMQIQRGAPIAETMQIMTEIAAAMGMTDTTAIAAQLLGGYATSLATQAGLPIAEAQAVGQAVSAGLASGNPQAIADAAALMDAVLAKLVEQGKITTDKAAEYSGLMRSTMNINDGSVQGSYEVVMNGISYTLETRGGELIEQSRRIRDEVQANLDASVPGSPPLTKAIPESYALMFKGVREVFDKNLPFLEANLHGLGEVSSPRRPAQRIQNNQYHFHVTGYMDPQALEGLAKDLRNSGIPVIEGAEVA